MRQLTSPKFDALIGLCFIILVLFCLILQQSSVVAAEAKCHLIEVEHCFDKLHTLKQAEPSQLLTSIDGLNRICRSVLPDALGDWK